MNTGSTTRGPVTIASGINVIAGIWLIIAPFILSYTDVTAAIWNDIILGILVIIFAAIRLSNAYEAPAVSWINVILGIWLIIAPFILGYSDINQNLWNDIILGIIVGVLALWSTLASPRAA